MPNHFNEILLIDLSIKKFFEGDQKKDLGIDNIPYIYYLRKQLNPEEQKNFAYTVFAKKDGKVVEKIKYANFIYLSICTYDESFIYKNSDEINKLKEIGEIVEVVVEIYEALKNTSKKPKMEIDVLQSLGFAPLATKLIRDKKRLEEFISLI